MMSSVVSSLGLGRLWKPRVTVLGQVKVACPHPIGGEPQVRLFVSELLAGLPTRLGNTDLRHMRIWVRMCCSFPIVSSRISVPSCNSTAKSYRFREGPVSVTVTHLPLPETGYHAALSPVYPPAMPPVPRNLNVCFHVSPSVGQKAKWGPCK